MKYRTANGWTKDKMKKQIKKYNTGIRAAFLNDCVYRCPVTMNRCAIGCFIPDKAEDKVFKTGGAATGLLKLYPELIKYMPLEDDIALNKFQNIHDSCEGNTHESLFKWIDENVED